MPKAVWTGSLAFGLVTIPVRLYPATEPKDVRFHLTDARGRRVRYRRIVEAPEDVEPWEPRAQVTPGDEAASGGSEGVRSPDVVEDLRSVPTTEREIPFEDLMRGYETDDGRLVLLDREDLEAVRPERSRTIEIEDFVDLADIDPTYFEKSYYLAPQRGGEKPYALLLRAIEGAGRVGIGRFVLRTKPHLVAIRPAGGVLGLETLFFGDEVRDGRSLVPGIDAMDVSDRELRLAGSLVDTLATVWDPSSYADTYREELLRRIAEKTPVETAEEAAVASPGGASRAEELMAALKASVEAAKERRRPPKRRSRSRSA